MYIFNDLLILVFLLLLHLVLCIFDHCTLLNIVVQNVSPKVIIYIFKEFIINGFDTTKSLTALEIKFVF